MVAPTEIQVPLVQSSQYPVVEAVEGRTVLVTREGQAAEVLRLEAPEQHPKGLMVEAGLGVPQAQEAAARVALAQITQTLLGTTVLAWLAVQKQPQRFQEHLLIMVAAVAVAVMAPDRLMAPVDPEAEQERVMAEETAVKPQPLPIEEAVAVAVALATL